MPSKKRSKPKALNTNHFQTLLDAAMAELKKAPKREAELTLTLQRVQAEGNARVGVAGAHVDIADRELKALEAAKDQLNAKAHDDAKRDIEAQKKKAQEDAEAVRKAAMESIEKAQAELESFYAEKRGWLADKRLAERILGITQQSG